MSYWQGKVALVTGGSAGLGRALATAFVDQGANVVITARGEDRLRKTELALRQRTGDVLSVPADVTRDADVERLFAQAIDRFGRLDVLVNNVGSSTRGLAAEVTPAEYQHLMDLNFLSAVRCTQRALGQLRQNHGHLVNIGSLASKAVGHYLGAYPASKFALAAYTAQLRTELADQGVHVLLVCPGPIAREDAGQRYQKQSGDLPADAERPGGGVSLRAIPADRLAARILKACQQRQVEIVVPWRARLLFAISQLAPQLGDWILKRKT